MAALSDQSAAVVEEARRRALIDDFVARADDSLPWTVIPNIALSLINPEADFRQPSPAISEARNLGRAFSARRGPTLLRIGPTLLVSTSVQTRRVLEPIARGLERQFGPRVDVHPPGLRLGGYLEARRRGNRLVSDLQGHLTSNGCELPAGVGEEVVAAAIVQARARMLFARSAPELVVVAAQHNSATRAVLAAAATAPGVRTAYLPHAPVADNYWYRDLPVQHALLRGRSEVEFYRSLMVSDRDLSIVGDPSISDAPAQAAPFRKTAVFATSPLPPDELRMTIRVIADARLGPIEVAPHPRMDTEALRAACPPEWSFNPSASTYERLAVAGASVLVQHGSGVGLEALGLGIAVVNLSHPGREPNYPYLTDPHTANVATSEALAEAVAQIDHSPTGVDQRRDYARSWCSQTGDAAVDSAVDVINDLLSRDPVGAVILDGWRKPTAQ
jgi:hypothetical protein